MAAQRKHTADVMQLRLDEDAIIDNAIDILARRLSSAGAVLGSPAAVKIFLTLQLAWRRKSAKCFPCCGSMRAIA